MSLLIYMYDNDTGVHLPNKIDTYPITLITKCPSVASVHNNICDCQLFCVFTKIQDADIVVQSENDAVILKKIIDFIYMNLGEGFVRFSIFADIFLLYCIVR